jgi:hypothetical protein
VHFGTHDILSGRIKRYQGLPSLAHEVVGEHPHGGGATNAGQKAWSSPKKLDHKKLKCKVMSNSLLGKNSA